MKRSIAVLMAVLGLANVALAIEPGTLTTLHAIHSLTKAQAAAAPSAAFEATVTYYDTSDVDLFVQEGGEAIYVETKAHQDLRPGDRVLIHGKVRNSFRPDVEGSSIEVLGHGALPAAVKATFADLVSVKYDCVLVTVRGTIRSADSVRYGNLPGIDLKLLMDGGYIDATVLGGEVSQLKDMLDAEVEVTGVASGIFDSKMQLTGILLEVTKLDNLKILKRAAVTPDSLPVTPMDQVLPAYDVRDLTRRVKVEGTITYYQPGSALVLQNGEQSLWIATQFEGPLRIGNLADASGFPQSNGDLLTLTRGEIKESGVAAPITPLPVSGSQLTSGVNAFNLVSIDGQVLMAAREAAQDEYILESNGTLFSAIYRHPNISDPVALPPMKTVPTGSVARVTGICMLQYGSDPFRGPVAVELLLRSFDDVQVVAQPSLLSVRNLVAVVIGLLAVVVGVGVRGRTLDRKVRAQTASLAARIEAEAVLERRRSRILEDINGTRPLNEIIQDIAGLVSFTLNGAPCWCELADGVRLGKFPAEGSLGEELRVEIPARSGPPLGHLVVAAGTFYTASANESEVLSMGVRLLALAIETRRLYSDLVHRSEFDLLTDIHNRFSLERRIDALIVEPGRKTVTFGLIFIDLDNFKLVNDMHGHRVGDLYLQEAAMRMKRQLRAGDLLARLGGDEFAALAPSVHSRSDVEDVARRLERCFDDPFVLEGNAMRGSASVGIALYPEDGTTRDTLLSVADAAMYEAKNARRPAQTPADPE